MLEKVITETAATARVNMCSSAKFGADRTISCGDMAIFDLSKWRSSAILDFQTLEILTASMVRMANMRHRAKLRADRTICCCDMAILRFFKMATVTRWI